jgi:hypothetical protein
MMLWLSVAFIEYTEYLQLAGHRRKKCTEIPIRFFKEKVRNLDLSYSTHTEIPNVHTAEQLYTQY